MTKINDKFDSIPRLNVAASALTSSGVLANTHFSIENNKLSAQKNLGPKSYENSIRIVGDNLEMQRITGVDFGIYKDHTQTAGSIGARGLHLQQIRTANVLGLDFKRNAELGISAEGIKFNGSVEIGGHTLIDLKLDSSACCTAVGEFLSGAATKIENTYSSVTSLFNTVPWASNGPMIANTIEVDSKRSHKNV